MPDHAAARPRSRFAEYHDSEELGLSIEELIAWLTDVFAFEGMATQARSRRSTLLQSIFEASIKASTRAEKSRAKLTP